MKETWDHFYIYNISNQSRQRIEKDKPVLKKAKMVLLAGKVSVF